MTWEYAPLAIQYLANACQVGFNFIEVPDPAAAPSYPVNSTCLRFPSTTLQTALLSQVQQIIPLVHIRVREAAVPDIYLSDRRCTVGGQLYLPRVLGLGEPGSDVIISQDIKGTADNVQFTFGNADRVMTALANDTDLKFAQIDLSLYHVNTGILLQLWSGFIVSFVTDGSPQFTVRAAMASTRSRRCTRSRAISRQCWKTFNDGVNCPYAAHGSGGDPTSCDYYFDSSQRLPGARHDAVLRRPSRRTAGRGHQGQLDRPVGLRPQHGHGDLDHLRHHLGQRAPGDLVQRRRRPGQGVLGELHDRRRLPLSRYGSVCRGAEKQAFSIPPGGVEEHAGP